MRPIPNQTKNDIINSVYSLSIIIPMYNEQERILKSLEILKKYIQKNKKNKIEIIFVSDGSTDQTNNIIRLFIKNNKKIKLLFISYLKNVGKGFAIKKGILKSKKNWILICDADMSVSPNQFNTWFKNNKIIDKNVAYFGSRRHEKSKVKTSISRKFLGMWFIVFIRLLLRINLKDSQCGFKVFHRSYAIKAIKRINSFRFAFDVDLVLILEKINIRIEELPLKWVHKNESKLNIFKDIPKMIYDLIVIKMRNFK